MTLLSWRIIPSDDPHTTFRALFHERLKPTIGHEYELERVYIDRDKMCLDEADNYEPECKSGTVTAVFGSFIK